MNTPEELLDTYRNEYLEDLPDIFAKLENLISDVQHNSDNELSAKLYRDVHSLKGTPLPLESTIPTAVFVIPSTLIWALMKRKRLKVK